MPQSLSELSQILQVGFYENFPASEPRNDRTRNCCVRVDVAVLSHLTSKGRDKVIKRSRDSSSKLLFTQSNWLIPYVLILRIQKCPINLWSARRLFLTTSVCESGFSALVALKCKERNELDVLLQDVKLELPWLQPYWWSPKAVGFHLMTPQNKRANTHCVDHIINSVGVRWRSG